MAEAGHVDPQILAASFGPTTSAVESIATSIGAGVLLGAFVMGALGTVLGWNAAARDGAAVKASYLGGVLVAVIAAVETIG